MNGPFSPPLFSNSWDLYRVMCDSRLDLKGSNGRDDALIRQLSLKLKIPYNDFTPEGLQRHRVRIEDFVESFFSILEPFSQMYADILSEMEQDSAIASKEDVLVKFDFDRDVEPITFDLRNFRRQVETAYRTTGNVLSREWDRKSLNELFKVFEVLERGTSRSI